MINPKKSQLRIISGVWRGTKLPVPDIEGLRPTPDRVRETVFNWVGADCRGSSVLDCFAGSGALGIEALSRGAVHLTLLEKNKSVWQNLTSQTQRLCGQNVEVLCGDALQIIAQLDRQFGLVFIDPPYQFPELRDLTIAQLVKHNRLIKGSRLYLEWPLGEHYELPSEDFSWLKRKKAGRVNYAMVEWHGNR